MNYKDFPAFKGITPEIEAYLDRFDELLAKNNQNLSEEEVLIRKIYLCSDYIDDKKRYGENNETFIKKIENRLQNQTNENSGVSLLLLAKGMYGNRRDVDNDKKMGDREYYNLIENWKSENNGLKVSLGDGLFASGWVYKTSPNYNPKKDLHRFILNVDPNQALFEDLDKFALKYNCQYKCAESQKTAYSRPDTIVIYTSDERIEEQKNILSSLVKPYVRANGGNLLDGEKIKEGLFYATEKNRGDIQKLIDEAQSIYPRLGDHLRDTLNNTTKNHPLSLGEFTIYKDILDSMKVLKNQKSQQKEKTNTNADKSFKDFKEELKAKLPEGYVFDEDKMADLEAALKANGNDISKIEISKYSKKEQEAPQSGNAQKNKGTVISDNESENGRDPNANSEMETPSDENWKEDYKREWRQWAEENNKEFKDINVPGSSNDVQIRLFDSKEQKDKGEYAAQISYKSPHNVSLTGANGKVPDNKYFEQTVALAVKKNGPDIEFGDIKSPEFKAKLLAACYNQGANPVNAPTQEEMAQWPKELQDMVNAAKEKTSEGAETPDKTAEADKTPKTDEKTENTIDLNKDKSHTLQTILKEGIKTTFDKADASKLSMVEIQNTEQANYSVDAKNPDLLIINGFDKNKNHTFSLQYDKSAGTYVYQGGKPEKTYSNDPNLNFAPLPENVLSLIKKNQRSMIHKASVKAEMRNGVEIKEGDSLFSVKLEKVGEHENSLVFEKKEKDGTPVSKFVVDRDSGEYIAIDYRSGERFTNSAKLSDKNLRQLPPEVITRYQNRIKQAEQTIINGLVKQNLFQEQRQ